MIARTSRGRYRVRVKARGVVVADRTFDRRTDASRWEREQKRLLESGDFVPPSRGRATVVEIASAYLDARRTAVSTRAYESDESAMRVHILPAWGPRPVGSISASDVERLLGVIATSRSVGTAARVRTTLNGLLGYAVRERYIRVSPADGVRLPRPDGGGENEIHPYTYAELCEVVEAQRMYTHYADVTFVLGLTGLRLGELRGLRIGSVVDVPYPALRVTRSLPQSGRTGAVIERTTTKTRRARLVPLADQALPVIERWASDRSATDLLFPAPGGGYLHAQNWRRAVHWNETANARRPHDLRHTAASLWIAAGLDIKTISAWLGHSTARLTLDTYGHLLGSDADRAAMAKVNAAFGDVSGTRAEKDGDGSPLADGQEGR